MGEFEPVRAHVKQVLALYDPQQHRSHAFRYGQDPGVVCLSYISVVLWKLGYPEQALQRSREALALAKEVAHPFSLALALSFAAGLHQCRREGKLDQDRAEALIALSREQGFIYYLAWGTVHRGWALAEQGQEEVITQMLQGLAAHRATGAALGQTYSSTLLADVYRKREQPEAGLRVLTEALTTVDKNGERFYEAELYRLKGQLTLQQFQVSGSTFQVPNPEPLTPSTQYPAPNT
jgi:predicted ATPase